MPGIAIDYQRAVILKAQGLTYKQVAEQLGANPASLRVGFTKRRLTKAVSDNKVEPETKPIANGLESASNRLRNELSGELHDQLTHIRSEKIKGKISEVSKRVQTVNVLTQTASKVYGWDNENDQRLVNVLVLSGYELADPVPVKAIDVETSTPQVVPEQPKPE